MVELNLALKTWSRSCVSNVFDFLVGFQNLLNALIADRRLGISVGHLREFLHGLVHFAQIQNEYD